MNYLKRLFVNEDTSPLPIKILGIMFVCLLFNAMTMTMVFSYLPQLVKWFGLSEVNTGSYAGLIASSLFVGRFLFSFFWGYLADLKGRKLALLIATSCLAITTFAFGMSNSFYWAFISRLLQGFSMGIIVISKAIIYTHCDDSNLPFGMSTVVGAFSFGQIIGPSIGGFLAFPAEKYPDTFPKDSMFNKLPILLPNLVVGVGLILAILLSAFIIPKDKKSQKYQKLTNHIVKEDENAVNKNNHSTYGSMMSSEESYLMLSMKTDNEKSSSTLTLVEPYEKKSLRKRLTLNAIKEWTLVKLLRTKHCMLCCILYMMYALVAVGYQEVFPIYAATIKQYKGIEFGTSEIGLVLLASAVAQFFLSMTLISRSSSSRRSETSKLIQLFLVACDDQQEKDMIQDADFNVQVSAKFGPRRLYIGCSVILITFIAMTPLVTLIKNSTAMWLFLIVLQVAIRVSICGCSLAINIMLNNSVPKHQIGSANGLGMAMSSVGRALSPPIFGGLYSWSLTQIKDVSANTNALGFPFNQYFSFFMISIIALINMIFVSRFPSSLDQKKLDRIPDLTEFHEHREIHLTVSEFNPQS